MPAARKTTRKARRQGRDGTVGRETFARVEKMMAEEKIKRAEAFRRISQETGRSAQTIATSYYRVARSSGVPLRKRRGAGRPPGAATARAAGGAGGAVTRAFEAVARLVRAQQSELAKLRAENTKYAALRRLLAK